MKKCLIIKNDGIGDLLCCAGVISSFAESFNGKVDLLVCKESKQIAKKIKNLHKIHTVSRDGIYIENNKIKSKSSYKDIVSLFFIKYFYHYDIIIVLRRFIRISTYAIMSYLDAQDMYCFAQFSTNFSENEYKRLAKYRYIYASNKAMWEAEYYKKCLNFIGFNKIETEQFKYLNINQLKQRQSYEDKNSKTIGLIITSRVPRTFLDFKWASIIDFFISKGYIIFLFGDSSRVALRKQYKNNSNVIDLCGKLKFLEHISYFYKCDGVLCEDTGLTHLAAISGVKTFVVQCERDNGFFFPYQNSCTTCNFYYYSQCRNCVWEKGKKECSVIDRNKTSIQCISSLDPIEISEWVLELIKLNFVGPKTINLNGKNCHYEN